MYNKKIKISSTLWKGYQYFCDIEHPLAFSGGRVLLHRHLMSIKIGRWLTSDEHIHHIDENKLNNNIDNLIICTKSEHIRFHRPPKKTIFCEICGKETSNKRFCSQRCQGIGKRKVEWPSKNELVEMLKNKSWCQIGRDFGVSDKAIRKWAKHYKII
jgi:endogenous inhibitor of DNA gyrase (YacG/DUF329 family)